MRTHLPAPSEDTPLTLASLNQASRDIAAIYAFFGACWILFSDKFLLTFTQDAEQVAVMSIYKGWLFIFVTSIMLFFLSRNYLFKVYKSQEKLLLTSQSLEIAYEELEASDEELRQQFDNLQNTFYALERSDQKYRLLFENMINAFALHEIICDDNGIPVDYRFLEVNSPFERVTGLSRENIIGKRVLEVFPNTEYYWIEIYGHVALTGSPTCITSYSCELGRYFQVEAYSPEKNHFAVQFLDVTDQIEHHERIEYMAYHDALTGLPNRTLFRIKLETAISDARCNNTMVTVIFLDLDDFKVVNDTLGHPAGDELLKVIGSRLTNCIGENDMVARMGGDEYTIFIRNENSIERISILADKIIQSINEPWQYADKKFRVTAKMGIALFPSNGLDADSLLKQADIAMYKAKENGKGSYQYYNADMESQIVRRLELENQLRAALENEQFLLYYQPQVDAGGRILGVEALLRWQHPAKGLVSPYDFINIAEDTGLIIPIGEWVLKTACRQNKLWQDMGLPAVAMSVNLSGRQFQQTDLITTINSALAKCALDSKWLTVEITESVAMNNVDHTITVLAQLKEKGIKIALDDFGIGYSSLAYLKRFPIDILKIDRSFISDLDGNSDGAVITKAIIGLGQNLKLNIIAEGVETKQQLEFLKNLSCFQMQGYLFSRPLPASDITPLLAKGQLLPPCNR